MNDPGTVLERWLHRLLPAGWVVQVMQSQSGGPPTAMDVGPHAETLIRLDVIVMNGHPGDIHDLATATRDGPVVAVAPWLSPRACEALRDHNINYVDSTGNIRLVLDDPVVFLARTGADAEPEEQDEAMLHRPKAIRFLRYLVDVSPKARVKELAASTDLSTGYVSQLLRILEAKGLVTRGRRGRLEDIALDGLLLQYAESYEAEPFNDTYTFSTSEPVGTLLRRLDDIDSSTIVSGSAAAEALGVDLPDATITLYVDDPNGVAMGLGLRRERHHGNVRLLRPIELFVTENPWTVGGVRYAAVPQIVADCFDANEPAAGEAVVRWALANVQRWRGQEGGVPLVEARY